MNKSHFVRFGAFNEKEYFINECERLYDGIVFNANLVAWAPSGIAGFLCSNNLIGKNLIIDPLTHSFQHELSVLENEDGEVKASIEKLLECYGEPVYSSIIRQEQPVCPDDFDEAILMEFCQRVIDFQLNTINDAAQDEDTWPYLKYAYDIDQDENLIEPDVVVAPYFYNNIEGFDEWLDLNSELIKEAVEYIEEIDTEANIASELVIERDILTSADLRGDIIDAYSDIAFDTIILWVDDFSEQNATRQELIDFRRFCHELRRNLNSNIINLYGGYYSILLCHDEVNALDGVCHGPQYGESRSVTPVGGGLPTAKFYLPKLHSRMDYRDVLRVAQRLNWLDSDESYLSNLCNCPKCRELLSEFDPVDAFQKFGDTELVEFQRGNSTVQRDFPTSDAQRISTKHYMFNKKLEFDEVYPDTGFSLDRCLGELQETYEQINEQFGLAIDYLAKWRDSLN